MTELSEQSAPDCGLLDKISFMAANRKAAHVTLMTANETTLRITKKTKFAGIRQVLNACTAPIHLEIICPSDEESQLSQELPVSAVDMFMNMTASNNLHPACQWGNITKATIKGENLRCLVPPFLATACPHLTHLTIVQPELHVHKLFTANAATRLPLTPCTSLKQLHLDSMVSEPGRCAALFQPPTICHTIAELRDNLPNVDTLIMRTPFPDLIEAFASQLTRLELGHHAHVDLANFNFNDACSCLKRVGADGAPLKAVKLGYMCSNDEIRLLMQLLNLTTLWLETMMYIPDEDWSDRTCSWQEVHINNIGHFEILANLSLSGLRKLSTGPDVYLKLPDPSDPSNLAVVQRAADNISRFGQIAVDDGDPQCSAAFGGRGTIQWRFPQDDNDEKRSLDYQATAAKMVTIAAQGFSPVKTCVCEYMLHQPLVLRAIFDWGHTFIETVCLGTTYKPAQHVWQALQQLQRLSTVVFWDISWDRASEKLAYKQQHIPNRVRRAAQHYVIPTQRALRIEFGMHYVKEGSNSNSDDDDDGTSGDSSSNNDDDDGTSSGNNWNRHNGGNVERIAPGHESRATYHAAIRYKLPAGSQLISFEVKPAESKKG